MTLSDVAQEAGTTAATLVQRFGSKRQLLLALAAAAAEGNKREFVALRTTFPSPSAALLLSGPRCRHAVILELGARH
jgi:AcrR family transcriptional regulator